MGPGGNKNTLHLYKIQLAAIKFLRLTQSDNIHLQQLINVVAPSRELGLVQLHREPRHKRCIPLWVKTGINRQRTIIQITPNKISYFRSLGGYIDIWWPLHYFIRPRYIGMLVLCSRVWLDLKSQESVIKNIARQCVRLHLSMLSAVKYPIQIFLEMECPCGMPDITLTNSDDSSSTT